MRAEWARAAAPASGPPPPPSAAPRRPCPLRVQRAWTPARPRGNLAPRQEAAMRAIFVMIKCEMGQAYRVAREMADSIAELSEMHSISGQYDLLGKFYLEPDQDIGLFVVEKVQSVPGVKDTYTLQTFNAFSAAR
ncbi:Lrp/AsnC ligand binding domain-containing protein [Rubritepida flocculans]